MKTAIAAGRPRERAWVLPGDGEKTSPSTARNLTAEALTGWGIDPNGGPGADVILCVSETVTNAVTHGAGPVTLTVECTGKVIVCHVTDDGRWRPVRGADPEHGRGLGIVAALADFDIQPGARTTVMFRIPLTALPMKAAA